MGRSLSNSFFDARFVAWPTSYRILLMGRQDPEKGGLADRPGDMVDVYHTCFGIAGLSLLNYEGLEPVDPM